MKAVDLRDADGRRLVTEAEFVKGDAVASLMLCPDNLRDPLEAFASDGAVFVRTNCGEHMCALYARDTESARIALSDAAVLRGSVAPDGKLKIAALRTELVPLFRELCGADGLSYEAECVAFRFDGSEDQLPLLLPQNGEEVVVLMNAQLEDAAVINEHWAPGCGHAGDYIREVISQNRPSCVALLDGNPVCWCLQNESGIFAFAHTVAEHRKKNLARTVIAALTRETLSRGMVPWAFVETDNTPSLRLFHSCGFTQLPGKYSYAELMLKQ